MKSAVRIYLTCLRQVINTTRKVVQTVNNAGNVLFVLSIKLTFLSYIIRNLLFFLTFVRFPELEKINSVWILPSFKFPILS